MVNVIMPRSHLLHSGAMRRRVASVGSVRTRSDGQFGIFIFYYVSQSLPPKTLPCRLRCKPSERYLDQVWPLPGHALCISFQRFRWATFSSEATSTAALAYFPLNSKVLSSFPVAFGPYRSIWYRRRLSWWTGGGAIMIILTWWPMWWCISFTIVFRFALNRCFIDFETNRFIQYIVSFSEGNKETTIQ